MKKASLVFQYIAIVLNIVIFVVATVMLIKEPSKAGELGVPVVLTIWAIETVVSLVFSILCIITLHKDRKVIAFGVLSLIFGSFFGGLFYLIWKPVQKIENNEK